MPGLAQLVAARRGAPVLPDERVVDRLAGVRVPGDDGLALVGDPDRVEAPGVGPGVGERVRRDPPGDVPDLVRVVLDPARAREVLAELAVGASPDPAVAVEDQAGRPRRSLVDSEDHGRRYPVRAPVHHTRAKSRSWAPRWTNPAERAAGRAVFEVELELVDPVAGADRVDRHPDLHPIAGCEREHRPQNLRAHRPLAGDRGARPRSRCGCGSPSGQSAARPRSRRRPGAGRRRRRGRTAPLRSPRPAAASRPAEAPRSPSQTKHRPSCVDAVGQCRLGGRGHVGALAVGAPAADHARAVSERDLGSPVGGRVVGDPELDLREGRGAGRPASPRPGPPRYGRRRSPAPSSSCADILPPA